MPPKDKARRTGLTCSRAPVVLLLEPPASPAGVREEKGGGAGTKPKTAAAKLHAPYRLPGFSLTPWDVADEPL